MKKYIESDGQTNTPEFKKWFGKSKVVKGGKPLVVYHGTDKQFNAFDVKKQGGNVDKSGKLGFFFSGKAKVASDFGKKSTKDREYKVGANIIPVYLSIKNPKEIGVKGFTAFISDYSKYRREAIKQGYDGVSIKPFSKEEEENWISIFGKANISEYKSLQYVAFFPNQIKSAIGNNGNFDSKSDNILESRKRYIRLFEV